ncbi:MAG TPA: multidrug efflux RND transporter permease subunit, partial [Candidatus Binataceae bacterium]|nr:multidrug efflux RND transporter permease subunit [Candidatus Binataceae bacterium]
MKIAHFFIDRPVFAIVISIVTVIAGAIAMFTLPIAQYPEIAPPTVTVTATYPGADAETMAKTVATPIEEQVNGVENMLYMSSQSTNDGNMTLTITFKVGTNLDVAQVQVQNRVAVALPQLPAEVQQEGVVVKKASPNITLAIAFYSPDGSHDALFISNYVTLELKDEIARLPGVGDITIFGVRDYSMRLWLDPNKMAVRSITAGDVISAVQEQNVQVAAGIIGGPPLSKQSSAFQYTLNAQGRLTDPSQFGNIIVKVGSNGRITRVKDIGRVELGAADYSTAVNYNGHPAVGLAVFQLPGTNALATADVIYAKMKELKKRFPPGLDYAIAHDTTPFVRESIKDLVRTLLIAVGLVALVVLVFLQSWRASLVPILAIPVSLIGTFSVMWLVGFSLNMLSLFGLVLAIGIVVDDAIVVVENVQRWLDEGLSPRDAAFRAMDEVTPAVIAIAFGLSAVFIPVAFIPGITGRFYQQFALTIAFSTLLSAFNSLTLSPALSALLLTPNNARQDWLGRSLNYAAGWFFRLFNRGFELTNQGYITVLKYVVRYAVIALIVYVGLVYLAYNLFKVVPTGFIPTQDQGYLMVNVQMPDASSIERTDAVVTQLSRLARETKGVQDAFAVAGFSILSRANSSAAGLLFVHLTPFADRAGKPDLTAAAIAGRIMQKYSTVQGGMAMVLLPPAVRGIGNAGGFTMQIEDRSGSATPQQLQAVTQRVIAAARKRPELSKILFSTFRANVPQVFVDVDRVKAKQENVTVADIFQTLQVYLGGYYINDFNYLGRTWHVMAQADAPYRATVAQVANLETRNASGQMVPLGALATMKDVVGPDRIQRYDLYSSADIIGAAAPGYSSGQALAAMEEVANSELPKQYSYEWTDLAFQEKAASGLAFLVFPLCVLFVWLTHSAEYESFALSTAIILIVPMCLLCGIAAVWARHMDNNIFTQIGFVVLAGMSVKNAVLIVEFAKQQQEHHPGMRAPEAAIEAARLRLRPILMTSLAFIFGVIPLILATGAGAEMRQDLGTVV